MKLSLAKETDFIIIGKRNGSHIGDITDRTSPTPINYELYLPEFSAEQQGTLWHHIDIRRRQVTIKFSLQNKQKVTIT